MDITWLQMILSALGITQQQPPSLFCDNISAISLMANPVFHSRTKHIAVDYHDIREKDQNKELQVRFLSSEHQLADLFTKPLSAARFHSLASKLLGDPPIRLRGDDNKLNKVMS